MADDALGGLAGYSACIEWLFAAEAEEPADRVRLAAAAGFGAVEFWSWRDKDVGALGAALEETGIACTAFVSEPMAPLTDPAAHGAFLDGLEASAVVARRLGAPGLIAQAGPDREGMPREAQHEAVEACLRRAAPILERAGVTLLIEPLNSRIDHPGYFLDRTEEGLDVVEAVGHPRVRLLYDVYHAAVMGEQPGDALEGRLDLVGHVHLADAPGRGEPGSGTMDWRDRLLWLRTAGYAGRVGLEYRPTTTTSRSLAQVVTRH